jgi:hypothetical protein
VLTVVFLPKTNAPKETMRVHTEKEAERVGAR